MPNPTPGEKTKGSGRKPGTPNKVTQAVKDMILGALDDCGGREYLASQAMENPAAFMALLGKVLPKDVHLQHNVTAQFIDAIRSIEPYRTISSTSSAGEPAVPPSLPSRH